MRHRDNDSDTIIIVICCSQPLPSLARSYEINTFIAIVLININLILNSMVVIRLLQLFSSS